MKIKIIIISLAVLLGAGIWGISEIIAPEGSDLLPEEAFEKKEEKEDEEKMKMANGWSRKQDEQSAVEEAAEAMEEGLGGNVPNLVVVYASYGFYDQEKIFSELKARLSEETKIIGVDNFMGVYSNEGNFSGLAIMGLYSPEMKVGVGVKEIEVNWQDLDRYKESGRQAILEAAKDAGATEGETPKIVIYHTVNQSHSIEIINGIEEIIGKEIPVAGGFAADESISLGGGDIFTTEGVKSSHFAVAAIYTDCKVSTAYGYGYKEMSEIKGVVTKADPKNRVIYEIDGKPAADVYNEWVGGKITDIIEAGGGMIGGQVLGRYPLKVSIPLAEPDHVLIGCGYIGPDKSITVMHEPVEEGTEVVLAEISSQEVIDKPGIVATIARARAEISKEEVAGALFIYCLGPWFFQEEMAGLTSFLGQSLGEAPFIGTLAAGENGFSPKGGNRVLAYSTVLIIFGKK